MSEESRQIRVGASSYMIDGDSVVIWQSRIEEEQEIGKGRFFRFNKMLWQVEKVCIAPADRAVLLARECLGNKHDDLTLDRIPLEEILSGGGEFIEDELALREIIYSPLVLGGGPKSVARIMAEHIVLMQRGADRLQAILRRLACPVPGAGRRRTVLHAPRRDRPEDDDRATDHAGPVQNEDPDQLLRE
jgi:hypothetical protein